ncbi:MAG TPA: nucleoside monophosphate kinase [Candidatus Saccharimonadales bacterium]|nr:nucleoside monophosphate kinase [Candidatus Saccharimonadales bacterium]
MHDKVARLQDWLGQGSINIFGRPYAGKDTQGETLADLFGAELLGGGEILRNSVIPSEVRRIMDAGDLIPTADFIRIVLPYLSDEKFANKPLILSAVGRWQGEEEGVLQATQAAGHPIKAVIFLNTNEALVRQRREQGIGQDRGYRADDAADTFEKRLTEFREKTLPVIEFYRQNDLLIEIDGSPKPPAVTESILDALLLRAQL